MRIVPSTSQKATIFISTTISPAWNWNLQKDLYVQTCTKVSRESREMCSVLCVRVKVICMPLIMGDPMPALWYKVCLSYLFTTMVKQHDQGNLQNEGFIRFLKIKAHGEWHIMAGWQLSWKLRAEGSYRDPQKGCRVNELRRARVF